MLKRRGEVAWILHGCYEIQGRVFKESQTIAGSGRSVTVYATWRPGLPEEEQQGKVSVRRIAFPWLLRLKVPAYTVWMFMPAYTIALLARFARRRPDVIHCMNFWTLHVGFLARVLLGVPYVYDSHDLFLEQNHMCRRRGWIRACFRFLEGFLCRRAAAVIQTTESRRKHFGQVHGVDAKVIMNRAVAPITDQFEWPPECAAQLQTEQLKLVYVGSIQEYRGLDEMLEAAADLAGVQCYILGSVKGTWGREFLRRYSDRVMWFPAVPPELITSALRSFDLGISLIQPSCLSYYYSCPTKVWELIASGTPQIASDFPEIRKVVVDHEMGPAGMVVDPENVGEIRASLEQLQAHPETLATLRSNCARLADHCSWSGEGQKLLGIYDDVERQ